MRRIQLAVAAIMALFALGAITAISQAAETTKILPEPTSAEPILATIKGNGGKLVALGGGTVTCKTTKGDVNFINANLGSGLLTFEGCTAVGGLATCTGEGDREGIILTTGTTHFILALEMTRGTETTLVSAFVILQKQFHFTCEAAGMRELVLVKGCSAGRDDSGERLTKNVLVLYKQWTTGETRILEVLMENTTKEIPCLGESSMSRNATEERFTLSALEGEATIEKWVKDEEGGKTREIEVLLMNKTL